MRKGNVAVVLLMVLMILAAFVLFVRYTPKKVFQKDETRQAVTEQAGAARKSVIVGVGKAMHEGLSTDEKAWFCNKPLPPSFHEANHSLGYHSNKLLESYFRGYQDAGYQNDHENITFNISLPLNDTAQIIVPGYSVIITDTSGSMDFTMNGIQKLQIVKEMDKIAVETAFNKTPGMKMGLVNYAQEVSFIYPLTTSKEELILTIDSWDQAQGATCIACAIYKAVELLAPPPATLPFQRERPLSIILMSDGGTNTCFSDAGIIDECKVLHYSVSAGCARTDAQQQAISYAREAFQNYGIRFYTVAFKTDVCTATDPLDCFDPDTMRQIACEGGNCSNFAYGETIEDLKQIYRRYGRDVASFEVRNFTYLRLEHDVIRADGNEIFAGINRTELQSKENISENYVMDFRTWYLYKKMVTWLFYYGDRYLLSSDSIKLRLTGYKPCNAVFTGTVCPQPGEPYTEHNESFQEMLLEAEDLYPHKILEETEEALNKYLNGTNITCEMEFTDFNLTNIPMFDYRLAAPVNLPIDTAFGNGSYRQSSLDGVVPRVDCPARPNFLGTNSRYLPAMVGPGVPINQVCVPGSYQYVGIDRTLKFDIRVRCQDPSIGAIMDGPETFEPLTLEFIIRVDMLSDCDPPTDTQAPAGVC